MGIIEFQPEATGPISFLHGLEDLPVKFRRRSGISMQKVKKFPVGTIGSAIQLNTPSALITPDHPDASGTGNLPGLIRTSAIRNNDFIQTLSTV